MFSHIIIFGSSLPELLGGHSLCTIICGRVLMYAATDSWPGKNVARQEVTLSLSSGLVTTSFGSDRLNVKAAGVVVRLGLLCRERSWNMATALALGHVRWRAELLSSRS
jgi:hypothetical protein